MILPQVWLIKIETLITEATFGLPIFKHPEPEEIEKLLSSIKLFSNKCHIVGNALEKPKDYCLLEKKGYDDIIYFHGVVEKITNYAKGKLGKLKKVTTMMCII